jgi:hypothetical protein
MRYHSSDSFMRKYWLAVLQGLLSVILVWRIFGNSDLLFQAQNLLYHADLRWMLVGLFTALLTESICAVRWWFMLRLFGVPVSLPKVFAFCGAGLFFSLALPGSGGGDAFRILYVIQIYPNQKLKASLSVLADRLCGLVALVAIFVVTVIPHWKLFYSDPHTKFFTNIAVIMLGSVMILMLLWWMTTLPFVKKQYLPFKRFIEKPDRLSEIFPELAKRPKLLVLGVIASALSLLAHFTTYFCSSQAFGINVSLGNILTIMPIVDTVILLPITLFGIGLREALFENLLGSLYGIDYGSAILASLGGFALQAIVALLGGLMIPLISFKR